MISAIKKSAETEKKPGTDAVKFLQQLRPGGPWVLTAIIPDGPTSTETFTSPEEARRFIVKYNDAGQNVYYSVGVTKDPVRKKTKKADIDFVAYLQVDADPKDDEQPAEFKARMMPVIKRFEHPPTFTIDSGNGLQLLWELEEPIKVTDEAVIADIEARNKALARAFGADPSTLNIDRIFRLPGTVNFPNRRKREIGRVQCQSTVIKFDNVMYPLSAFPPHEEIEPHEEGDDYSFAVGPDTSGSGYGLAFLRDCKKQGMTFEEACEHIRADKGKAGKWARDADERKLRLTWDKIVVRNLHSWTDPDTSLLDDRRGDLPEFPIETLRPEALQDLIENAAEGAGTLVDHVAVPLLGIAGSLIGTSRRVRASSSWTQPMTLWVGVVGFSGSGKSPGLAANKRPLDEVEFEHKDKIDELRREHELLVEKAKAAEDAWKKEVKEAIANGEPPPPKPKEADSPGRFVEPRLYVSDTTIERMVELLRARPQGMLVIGDELAGLFENMSRYSGGRDNSFWLMAWDGNVYKVERMTRTVEIPHLLVGLVGGLQPDKFAECFKGSADGMYARFFLTWPSKAPYRPLADTIEEVDPDMVAMLKKLAWLEKREPLKNQVRLSENALATFEELRKTVSDGLDALDGRERDWWSKIPAHVLRLAGTLAYMRWALVGGKDEEPKEIKSLYVNAAGELVLNYFWPHARACLRQIGLNERDAHVRRVLRWIEAKGLDEVSRQEVREHALSRRLNADQAHAVLERLERAGWLRTHKAATGEKGGRPVVRWEVNPLLRKVHESTKR